MKLMGPKYITNVKMKIMAVLRYSISYIVQVCICGGLPSHIEVVNISTYLLFVYFSDTA